jgi:hypothetical protein
MLRDKTDSAVRADGNYANTTLRYYLLYISLFYFFSYGSRDSAIGRKTGYGLKDRGGCLIFIWNNEICKGRKW